MEDVGSFPLRGELLAALGELYAQVLHLCPQLLHKITIGRIRDVSGMSRAGVLSRWYPGRCRLPQIIRLDNIPCLSRFDTGQGAPLQALPNRILGDTEAIGGFGDGDGGVFGMSREPSQPVSCQDSAWLTSSIALPGWCPDTSRDGLTTRRIP